MAAISVQNEPLDHPSYLTRQMLRMGKSTAGNGTISGYFSPPFNMRVRGAVATSITTSTTALFGVSLLCYGTCVTGYNTTTLTTSTTTATLGTIVTGTNTVAPSMVDGGGVFSADMDALVYKGSILALKNQSTDASGVLEVAVEWYHDPLVSAWTPGN